MIILHVIFAIFGVIHFCYCNQNQYSSFGNVAVQQGAIIESDRPVFPMGGGYQQQPPLYPVGGYQQQLAPAPAPVPFFGAEPAIKMAQPGINVFRPTLNVGIRENILQPALFAGFPRHHGYGFGPRRFEHYGHRFAPFLPHFDYNRGCCRRPFATCHRPLCDAPGFDYYDEVHHCCHRQIEGCFHRPLCAREYNFYDRSRECCRRPGRGCHRPLCPGGRFRPRHHHDRPHHDHHDHHDRSRSDEHHHEKSRSNERHHGHRKHHFGHHSFESHSHSHENVRRPPGHRPKPILPNYPAFLPYLQFNNGTKQLVNQNVHVNVHQNSKCGFGSDCYKKS